MAPLVSRPVSAEPADRELMLDRIAANIAISRFRRRWEAERLGMYRLHLQVGVVAASPLVKAAGRLAGVDVAAQMWRLRPPFGWPAGDRAELFGGIVDRLASASGVKDRGALRAGASVVVRPLDPLHGPVTLRIDAGAVELSTTIGEVHVRTDCGFARLRLGFRLPDQVADAAVGLAVGVLVGHPWFVGREWPIRAVVDRGTAHELLVATGQVGFEMPWRRSIGSGGGRQLSAGFRP